MNNINTNEFTVFLFGSRASGTARFASDIDIGVLGNKKITLAEKSKILDLIEESIVPYKVEIVDFSNVSEIFRKTAMKNVKLWNQVQTLPLN